MTTVKLDLGAADLRISRGSVPASAQLAEALKAQIVQQRLPHGGRLPSERELIERSGLSRVTVRAAVGLLERQGWLVRRQGLGTFVADPVKQELASGVRTITEVLLGSGVTRRWTCCRIAPAPRRDGSPRRSGCRKSCVFAGVFGTAINPGPGHCLPSDRVGRGCRTVAVRGTSTETTYTMWEQRLDVRIARATHEIQAAGAPPEVADALGLAVGSPVLVLERTSYTADDKPIEVVVFHYRPEWYRFAVTLPRTMPEPGAGIIEKRDFT